MPIYAYRCTACGHAQDVLQKITDDVLTVCPACGQSSYVKQVTAAGFQLKGSGWYVTDFRGGQAAAKGQGAEAATEGKKDAAGTGKEAAKEGAPAAAEKPAATPAAASSPPAAPKSGA